MEAAHPLLPAQGPWDGVCPHHARAQEGPRYFPHHMHPSFDRTSGKRKWGKEWDQYLSWWIFPAWSTARPREPGACSVNLAHSRLLAVYSCLCTALTLKSGLVLWEGPPGLAQRLSCRMPGRRDRLDRDVSFSPVTAGVCTPGRAGDACCAAGWAQLTSPCTSPGFAPCAAGPARVLGAPCDGIHGDGEHPFMPLLQRRWESPKAMMEPAQTPRPTLHP